jgi:glycerophosphoryl diester phosphodiesterase
METVKRFKTIAPDLPTGLIFDKEYRMDVFEGNWEILSSNYELVDDTFMRLARESGKKTYVWTVNDREEMFRLIDLGVDGIITDKPDLLLSVLGEIR